ncbi:two-component sensor histidine kinase [Dictyobacter sp. S3.2.2.5]|uniref:histidine kinase n=1 Tax=Dictyobacter halimunensis TaxID=3026934 RepID=A0ABQ6FSB2_9CHLR|nr:two-component sensor histidine kinase [Dictyobacter sp. S3.2.2.5]
MDKSKKRWRSIANKVSIRWRLTLISLGLLTLLLSALGVIILFTAEQALYSNEATSLRYEARLAVNSLKNHPLRLVDAPGPPAGPLDPTSDIPLKILAQKIASTSDEATILAPDGTIIATSTNAPFTPSTVLLSFSQVRQTLQNDQQGNNYLIQKDVQGKRQIVVLLPLEQDNETVAILQVGRPIDSIDNFMTTLRLILLLGTIGALGLATALTFPLISVALHPLVDMERSSREIANGALWLRLNTELPNDEIGVLARSFNSMVAQLETAFQQQKRFVADVSHELRTPLTALNGSLEMLLLGADKGNPETTRRLTKGMYAEVQRMHRLVEDLLALTRLDEHKLQFRQETIDIQKFTRTLYDQAQQLAHGQNITRLVAENILPVRADADKLQQTLLNIIDNALKFTPATGQVKIIAYNEEPDTVIIEIQDTGKGIPADALPHIFDRFYRVDSARSRSAQKVGGNGLGLAIAKELIEAQGGNIIVQSQLDKGTTVTLRLPAIPPIQEHNASSDHE